MLVPQSVFHLHECCNTEDVRYRTEGSMYRYSIGVLFRRAKDGTSQAVATDGRRAIAVQWKEVDVQWKEVDSPNGERVIVSKKICAQVAEIADGTVKVRHANEEAVEIIGTLATTEATVIAITAKPLADKFPLVEDYFPHYDESASVSFTVDAALLVETLQTMSKVSAPGGTMVRFTAKGPEDAVLMTTAPDKDGKEMAAIIMPYYSGEHPKHWVPVADNSAEDQR